MILDISYVDPSVDSKNQPQVLVVYYDHDKNDHCEYVLDARKAREVAFALIKAAAVVESEFVVVRALTFENLANRFSDFSEREQKRLRDLADVIHYSRPFEHEEINLYCPLQSQTPMIHYTPDDLSFDFGITGVLEFAKDLIDCAYMSELKAFHLEMMALDDAEYEEENVDQLLAHFSEYRKKVKKP